VNIHRLVFAGLLGLIATTIQPQITLSYTAEKISSIAKEVTVTVDSEQEKGSGVIIAHQGNEYTVLTNWHVLNSKDTYTVKTKDGTQYQIRPGSIKHIAELDLAVCTFISNKLYRVADLGNSDTIGEGSTLYVTGAPANLEGISSRNLLVVGGQLVGYDPTGTNGYTLIYNNNTMPGMSGGSVMDSNGNLIGIHGRGSRDTNKIKSGFNLGIPINSFVNNANRLGIKYTLDRPRLDGQNAPVLIAPKFTRGRPSTVDGSENAPGACAGEKC
jgi:serine protease Do